METVHKTSTRLRFRARLEFAHARSRANRSERPATRLLFDTSKFVATVAVTFVVASILPLTTADVHGQIIDDTLFVWRGYSRTSETRLSIYESTDEKRPHVAVLTEVESNKGMSVTEDGRYVVEQIGREYGIDPSKVVWFFRWGAYSFPEAAPVRKQLILRATFNRSKNGNLGLPLWRVAAPAEVEELTDRRLRLTR